MYTDDLDRRRRRKAILAWLILCAALAMCTALAPAHLPEREASAVPTADRSPTYYAVLDIAFVPDVGEPDPLRLETADGPWAAGLAVPAAPQPDEHPIEAGGAYGDPDGPAGATTSADAVTATTTADADGITLPPVAHAIRRCESGGNYQAKNPISSASGAWQFIDATWEWVTGLPAPANAYPPHVQDQAFLALWDGGDGWRHWEPSIACWGAAA